MKNLIEEYKMISNTLFSMNAITNDQKEIAKEYSNRPNIWTK
jgi:hypothetical protein